VAFDKTGTLTRGAPKLTEIRPFADVDRGEALRLAAATEQPSEHPLAEAIVRAARERGLDIPQATEFVARPGRGVAARVHGDLVEVTSPTTAGIEQPAGSGTVVVVSRAGKPIATLSMTDEIRAVAADAVAALTALTGTTPVLLTGDNRIAADEVARQVGITDVRADLLPEDKVAAVDQLTASGRRVAVVGDGINDAPALTAAHTGIAMGGRGADLTLHAADAVIVRDDLNTIASAIALSRRARRVVTANLVIAAVFIAGLVTWDLIGHLPLPLGVAGHEGSTIIVGLNGLRLLRNSHRYRKNAPARRRR
jgi:P-type E1-E2 ATPase